MNPCIITEPVSIEPARLVQVGAWHPALQGTTRSLCSIREKYACTYHDAVEKCLARLGWAVRREYPVVVNGRGGRVDIVAEWSGITLALELDNRSPRGKSILKLTALPLDWNKGVLLRNP